MAPGHEGPHKRQTIADSSVIEIPDELANLLATPTGNIPWPDAEIDLLRRTYPTAKKNNRVTELAAAWEKLTGTRRTKSALRGKASSLGL